MIQYSIDTNERHKFYLAYALLSVALSSVLSLFDSFATYKVAAPSALMMFAGLTLFHNKFGWKMATKFRLSQIPNLNGVWEGCVERADNERFDVEAIITQTWEKLDCRLESDVTTGHTELAALFIENDNRKRLKLVYRVRSTTRALNDYRPEGEGVNDFELRVIDGKETLAGPYYGSKGRGGKVTLIRQSR